MPKTYFSWSTGKDASLAFYHLNKQSDYDVDRLVTSINQHHDRVSMHGLRRSLLERQAAALGLPLTTIELPEQPTMGVYDQKMAETLSGLSEAGYTHSGFGDIFLEDLKAYRDAQMKPFGIEGVYPIWKQDTRALVEEFISLGFKAVVLCCKAELLDESFIGREIDASFLADLPDNVDPCGENGEFHTFCYAGPIFSEPIQFEIGEKIYREYKRPEADDAATHDPSMGFWFCDLVPT